jgi:hypothetical protein
VEGGVNWGLVNISFPILLNLVSPFSMFLVLNFHVRLIVFVLRLTSLLCLEVFVHINYITLKIYLFTLTQLMRIYDLCEIPDQAEWRLWNVWLGWNNISCLIYISFMSCFMFIRVCRIHLWDWVHFDIAIKFRITAVLIVVKWSSIS